jgi:hypothetical protein
MEIRRGKLEQLVNTGDQLSEGVANVWGKMPKLVRRLALLGLLGLPAACTGTDSLGSFGRPSVPSVEAAAEEEPNITYAELGNRVARAEEGYNTAMIERLNACFDKDNTNLLGEKRNLIDRVYEGKTIQEAKYQAALDLLPCMNGEREGAYLFTLVAVGGATTAKIAAITYLGTLGAGAETVNNGNSVVITVGSDGVASTANLGNRF